MSIAPELSCVRGRSTEPASGSDMTRLSARAVDMWRALVAAALLSLALAAALSNGMAAKHGSVPPAARSGLSQHKGLSSLPLAAQGLSHPGRGG